MKNLLTIAIILINTSEAFSQTFNRSNVQPFEASILLGGTLPITECLSLTPQIAPGFGAEVRYNIGKLPLSFGLLFEQTLTWYNEDNPSADDQQNRTVLGALTVDWNFREGKKANPFAGLAAGISSLDSSLGVDMAKRSKYYPILIPRIGVELGYHFRTQIDFNMVRKGFSNVQFTIGATIGGGPSKK